MVPYCLFDYEYDNYSKQLLPSETGIETGCGPLIVSNFLMKKGVYSMIYRHQGAGH